MSRKQKNLLEEVLLSRPFWMGLAATASTGLIFYDWYSDRYASPRERYLRIEPDYCTPMKQLCKIRTEFLKDMKIGLTEKDEISSDSSKRKSSLKMLSSNIYTIPDGTEKGTYYALDWGGSTFRVIRITFKGRNHESKSIQLTQKLEKKYMTVKDEKKLFNYLSNKLKQLMIHVKDMPDDNNNINNNNNNNNNNNGNKTSLLKRNETQYDMPVPPPMDFPDVVQGYHKTTTKETTHTHTTDDSTVDTSTRDTRDSTTDITTEEDENVINDDKDEHIATITTTVTTEADTDVPNIDDDEKIFDSHSNISIGFCFSFPMLQPKLSEGILLQWTKGFTVPNCVGKNIASLMDNGFKRNNLLNCKIDSMVNDTVGTLLACAYDNDHTRIGVILGTGTNAAYVEPLRNNEIINTEWGNFNKYLPRVPPDWIMDEYTPNTGVYWSEKMISGMYLGELCRLLSIEIFREKITNYCNKSILNLKWKFGADCVSKCLEWYFIGEHNKLLDYLYNKCNLIGGINNNTNKKLYKFTLDDAEIFGSLCKLIVYRSADISASMLASVLEKTGLYYTIRKDERNPFEKDKFILNNEYKNNKNKYITVGIDGSVYLKCTGYSQRLRVTLEKMLGREISNKIIMVHSEDGSGKGAALAAARAKDNSQVASEQV